MRKHTEAVHGGNRLYGEDRPTVHNARRYVRVLILLQRCRSVHDGRVTVVVGVNQVEGSRQLLCLAHSGLTVVCVCSQGS